MDICSLRNIKKLTKKWEQWEQEKIHKCNQFIKPIEERNNGNKPRTKWEQEPGTTHTIEEETLIHIHIHVCTQTTDSRIHGNSVSSNSATLSLVSATEG